MFKRRFVLMDQATDPSQGGSGNVGQGTQTPGNAPPPAPNEETGFDPLKFYEQQTPSAPPPPAPVQTNQSQQATPPAQPQEGTPAVSTSGYGQVAPPPPAPAEQSATPPAEPPAVEPPPVEDPYVGLVVEGLAPEDGEALKEFAKANGLSKEAAQNFINLKKAEMEIGKKQFEKAKADHQAKIQAQRTTWTNNLKQQWGTSFDNNVHITEKFIREFMPETNNWLTSSKTMLPDYVMRDLYKNAKAAYETEPAPARAADGDSVGNSDNYDPLAFYNEKLKDYK